MHEGRRQQLINIHIITTRSSRRSHRVNKHATDRGDQSRDRSPRRSHRVNTPLLCSPSLHPPAQCSLPIASPTIVHYSANRLLFCEHGVPSANNAQKRSQLVNDNAIGFTAAATAASAVFDKRDGDRIRVPSPGQTVS